MTTKAKKSSRRLMANRMKWGRGGNAQGGRAPESPKTLGQILGAAIREMFRRKV